VQGKLLKDANEANVGQMSLYKQLIDTQAEGIITEVINNNDTELKKEAIKKLGDLAPILISSFSKNKEGKDAVLGHSLQQFFQTLDTDTMGELIGKLDESQKRQFYSIIRQVKSITHKKEEQLEESN
jgi:hypothetical protein